MTRFARAKGSKSSNERLPQTATSWAEMKQQIEQKIKEKEDEKHIEVANQKRAENYNKFLQEQEEKVETGWAEFPPEPSIVNKVKKKRKNSVEAEETVVKKKAKNPEVTAKEGGKKKKLLKVMQNVKTIEVADNVTKVETTENNGDIKKMKKKNKLLKSEQNVKTIEVADDMAKVETTENNNDNKKPKKKKNKKKKNATENSDETPKEPKEKVPRVLKHLKNGKVVSVKVKVKKPVEDVPKKNPEDMNEEELKIYQKKKDKKHRQVERRKQFRKENKLKAATEAKLNPSAAPAKPSKRRKEPQCEIVKINGREIRIAYFMGFPIKEEDAKRIGQLKKDMISRGLPRSEVNIALKLERRRAEKSLAREKKNVCFNCRQAGHNLSECPELANSNNAIETVGDGICFKCGSTEHTHFQCRVVKGDKYNYASCFICKEQGHIARQCPDNARGLYPKGGACKLCGDVTHLKKDCPTHIAEQESKSIGLGTIGDDIEMLEDESSSKVVKASGAVNKIIKF